MTLQPMGKFWIGVGMLLAAYCPLWAQETTLKIAVVDVERVVNDSNLGQALRTRLEQFDKTLQAEIAKKTEEAQAIRNQLVQGSQTLSSSKQSELRKQLEDASIAIRRYQDDKSQEAQIIQDQGLERIKKELKPVFEKMQAEQGYDLFLNKTAGVVIMAGAKVDLTNQVLEALNNATK